MGDVMLPTKKKSDKAEGKVAMPPMDMAPIAGPSSEGVRSALAAMGFSDKSLIELIIATHGEDVEACARALAAASEWAHLLDDLEEMGFANRELNKSLLLKNAGNMKRTVRDLVEAQAHGWPRCVEAKAAVLVRARQFGHRDGKGWRLAATGDNDTVARDPIESKAASWCTAFGPSPFEVCVGSWRAKGKIPVAGRLAWLRASSLMSCRESGGSLDTTGLR